MIRPTRDTIATAGGIAAAWGVAHLRAPAVRGWSPPRRDPADGTTLATTVGGSADRPVVVLLHGITASGRSYGADFDDLPGRVVVPDLLGFGGSMDVRTDDYSLAAHVSAVARTLDELDLAGRPTVVVGHSMGAVLALHVARALDHPLGVVAFSAPLYDHEAEGMSRIGEADLLAGLLAVGDLAERVCAWMCAHRRTASVLWPLLAPHWPWPLAADGVLHTWPAYRGSLQSLVLDSDYADALAELGRRGVPVSIVNGSNDAVPVPARATRLARAWTNVETVDVAGAGHPLPISRAERAAGLVADRVRQWSPRR